MNATQHVVVVRPLRKHGQMFADRHSRHARADRLEFATNLGGSIGLQVPRIEMRAAALQQNDDRLLGSIAAGRFVSRCCTSRQHRRQSKRTHRNAATKEEPAVQPFSTVAQRRHAHRSESLKHQPS
jgi:hypothetical protein